MQTLIDAANVKAVSIFSITIGSAGDVDEPPPAFTEHTTRPFPVAELIGETEPTVDPSLAVTSDMEKTKLTPQGDVETSTTETEDAAADSDRKGQLHNLTRRQSLSHVRFGPPSRLGRTSPFYIGVSARLPTRFHHSTSSAVTVSLS